MMPMSQADSRHKGAPQSGAWQPSELDLTPLRLEPRQLRDIARAFADRVREGLSADGHEIRCLPTYLPAAPSPERSAPTEAYVLDIGGSNLRAAVVGLDNGRLCLRAGPVERSMPWRAGQSLDADAFFAAHRRTLESLGYAEKHGEALPLGYCFSYPAESLPDGDARLIKWTKEIDIAELVGEPIGRRLLHSLNRHSSVRCSRVVVVNDTVASLLSGLEQPGYDAYVGLVAGTGFNIAALFERHGVPKLAASKMDKTDEARLAVNLECGNFTPPWLTAWDETLDRHSLDRGRQRLEKSISGGYLGTLAEIVLGETGLPDAAALARVLSSPASYSERHAAVAEAVFLRSAKLVAAALAGLGLVLTEQTPIRRLRLTAEGGLFWGHVNDRQLFYETALATLQELQSDLKLGDFEVDCVRQEHANLFGAAMAVLRPEALRKK